MTQGETRFVRKYDLRVETPTIEVYRHLLDACEMIPRLGDAACIGLQNSFYSVMIYFYHIPVGMGRIIGDGGYYYQFVDIAVHPEHQGHGLGKRIMAALVAHLEQSAPKDAYALLVDGRRTYGFYAPFGFEPIGPGSICMAHFF